MADQPPSTEPIEEEKPRTVIVPNFQDDTDTMRRVLDRLHVLPVV